MNSYHDHLKIVLPFWAEKWAETLGIEVDWCEYQKDKIKNRIRNSRSGSQILNEFEEITIEEQSNGAIRLTGDVAIGFDREIEISVQNNAKQKGFSRKWIIPIYQVFLDLEKCAVPEAYIPALHHFKLDGQSVCYQAQNNILSLPQKNVILNNYQITGYDIKRKRPYEEEYIRTSNVAYFDTLMNLQDGFNRGISDFFQMIQIIESKNLGAILFTMLDTIKHSEGQLYSNNVICGVLDIYEKVNPLQLDSAEDYGMPGDIKNFSDKMQEHPELLQELRKFIVEVYSKHKEKLTVYTYVKMLNLLRMIVKALPGGELKNDIERLREKMWEDFYSLSVPVSQIQNEPEQFKKMEVEYEGVPRQETEFGNYDKKNLGSAFSCDYLDEDEALDDDSSYLAEDLDGLTIGLALQKKKKAEYEAQLETERQKTLKDCFDQEVKMDKEARSMNPVSCKASLFQLQKTENKETNNSFLSDKEFNFLREIQDNKQSMLPCGYTDKDILALFKNILIKANEYLDKFESNDKSLVITPQDKEMFDIIEKIYTASEQTLRNNTLIQHTYIEMDDIHREIEGKMPNFQEFCKSSNMYTQSK